MAEASSIEARAAGEVAVSGLLEFATVTALLAPLEALLPETGSLRVDLGAVRHTDSAGLALLVHWQRLARQRGLDLEFHHAPDQLMDMARLSGLDGILPLRGTPAA
jgi:phospholipid transport system transporter-binding protein